MNAELPHDLEREVLIHAPRDLVFRYFTDSTRFARWFGEGSTIEARPGGRVQIRYPGAVAASGTVLAIEPPAKIAFSYGYDSGKPIAAGTSRITITLHECDDGTLVRLHHAFGDAAVRDHHVQGWRYHMSVFATVVADEQHRGAAAMADRWFQAWAEPDAVAREALLAACTTDDVAFRDRYSTIRGRRELAIHVGAVQHHMPGIRLARQGDARQCQGTALIEWQATHADGRPFASGTNVLRLAKDGRIADVTGLWR